MWGAGSYKRQYFFGGELAFAAHTPNLSLHFLGGYRKHTGRLAFLADAGVGFTEDGGYDFYGSRGWFHDGIVPSGALRIHGLLRFYRSPERLDLNLAVTADARTTFDGDEYGAAIGFAFIISTARPEPKKPRARRKRR